MKKLFENVNFKLLFAGSMVSEIGNSLFGIAMSFYIYDLTDDNVIIMGIFMFVVGGTRLLVSPLSGVLVDRWNKVRVIYINDFLRGLLFIALVLFILGGRSDNSIIVALFIVGILSSASAAFFAPAVTSVLPEIVGEDMLQEANGAQSIIMSVQSIIGVLAGAALYAFIGVELIIILNAVSFIASGFSEMYIKTEHKRIKSAEEIKLQFEKSKTQDFKDSIEYIKERTGLFSLVGYSLVLNFAFTPIFAVGIVYLFKVDLARVNYEMEYAISSVVFSVVMLIAGVIVGGLKFKSIHTVLKRSLLMLSTSFAYIAFTMFLASNRYVSFTTFYIMFIVGMILLGAFMMFTNVPLNTGMVKIVDPDYRGRVFSTIGAISSGAVPLSMLIGAIIIHFYGISILGLFCVIIMLYPTFGFITNKKVNQLINSIDKHNEENGKLQETV